MADTQADKVQTLAEQYSLEKDTKPVEVEVAENPGKEVVSEEPPAAVTEVTPAAVTEVTPAAVTEVTPAAVTEVTPAAVTEVTPAAEETSESVPTAADEVTENNPTTEAAPEAAPEESNDSTENSEDQETPEIKLETAPVDFRFPTTNQSRHCFTRYVEYHRCIAAKGEDAPECDKFAKFYRSLCPGEWVERWNEQRENGTFPGPL